MKRLLRLVLQVVFFVAFATFVVRFSTTPRYEYASPEMAVLKFSLSHAAQRIKPCVQLTVEQIAAMPANDRHPARCERERLPLTLQLEVDGDLLVNVEAVPAGVWKDGAASVYERFDIEPGAHRLTVRLRDSARTTGWDYVRSDDVELEAGRYFTVTFSAAAGGFEFQ